MLKVTLKIISKVILWLIVFVLLFIVGKLLVGQIKGKAVFFGNSSFLRIATESMVDKDNPENGINAGDLIVIKKVNIEDLKVGDIISFYSNDKTISGRINTHRIMDISPDLVITTKGDNNLNEDDAKVYKDDIIGRYEKKLVFITAIMNILTKNIFVFVLIVGIIVMLAVVSILKNSKLIKCDDEQKKIDEEIEKIKKQGIEEYSKNLNNKEVAENVSKIENKEEN